VVVFARSHHRLYPKVTRRNTSSSAIPKSLSKFFYEAEAVYRNSPGARAPLMFPLGCRIAPGKHLQQIHSGGANFLELRKGEVQFLRIHLLRTRLHKARGAARGADRPWMSGRERRTRGRTGFVTAGHRPFLRAPWGLPQGVGASRLRRSWLSETLTRAFGLGHSAVVEQSPENPPDDRTKDVEPETRKIPSNYHRAQRARWVDRPPGHRPCDEDPYR